MSRQLGLLLGAALCLSIAAGCTVDDAWAEQIDAPAAEWQLEREWQNIIVLVAVPSSTYRFEVFGRCGLDGQSIYAEGTSRNAEFSVHVSKDAYSGLALVFSNQEDEWETLLDPAADTSKIDGKKVFRFKGEVTRNHDESNLESIELGLHCEGV